MPEYEHPGVYVEKGAKPKPIEGVPTNGGAALSATDRAYWLYGIAIGAIFIAGLGVWVAIVGGSVIEPLLDSPGGAASIGATFILALLLAGLKTLVEWHRRSAGRPPLRRGKVALGVVLLQLAMIVAFGLCVPALLLSWLVGSDFTTDLLLEAGINVVVGCTLVALMGSALRDLLLLVQAVRNDP